MSDKKKLTEWEREKGVLIKTATGNALTELLTEEEFTKYITENFHNICGVNWTDRIEFLKQHGYEVTRANITDSSLSNTSTPDAEFAQNLTDSFTVTPDEIKNETKTLPAPGE